MIKVNLLIPAFQVASTTTQQQIIQLFKNKTGLIADSCIWFNNNECIIQPKQIQVNLDILTEALDRSKIFEQQINKFKKELSDMSIEYTKLMIKNKQNKENKQINQQSVNIQESRQNLQNEIKQLTRQNIRLKDNLKFYEVNYGMIKQTLEILNKNNRQQNIKNI